MRCDKLIANPTLSAPLVTTNTWPSHPRSFWLPPGLHNVEKAASSGALPTRFHNCRATPCTTNCRAAVSIPNISPSLHCRMLLPKQAKGGHLGYHAARPPRALSPATPSLDLLLGKIGGEGSLAGVAVVVDDEADLLGAARPPPNLLRRPARRCPA